MRQHRLDTRIAGVPAWVVGGSAALALLAVLAVLWEGAPLAWIWWGTCLVVTVSVTVWFAARGRLLEPLPLVMATCGLLFVTRPLQLMLGWRDLYSHFFPKDPVNGLALLEGQEVALFVERMTEPLETAMSRALGACALFVVLLLAGYRLWVGGRLAQKLSELRAGSKPANFDLAIGVSLAIGVLAQVALIARGGGPKAALEKASDQAVLSDSFVLFLLSGFGFAAVFIWAAWRWPRRRAEWIAFGASVATVCGFSILLGSRARVFLMLAVLALIVHYTRRRWRGRELALGLVALLALASSLLVFRAVSNVSSLGKAAERASAHMLDHRIVLNDISSFDHVLYATSIYGRSRDHENGAFLVDGARSYLPRRIDPGKPEGGDIVLRKVVWKEEFGAGRPPTAVGDLFIDFGLWGVAIGALLLGVLSRALGGLLRGGRDGREYRVVLFALSMVVLYALVADTFSLALGHALTLIGSYLIAIHVFGRISRRAPLSARVPAA